MWYFLPYRFGRLIPVSGGESGGIVSSPSVFLTLIV